MKTHTQKKDNVETEMVPRTIIKFLTVSFTFYFLQCRVHFITDKPCFLNGSFISAIAVVKTSRKTVSNLNSVFIQNTIVCSIDIELKSHEISEPFFGLSFQRTHKIRMGKMLFRLFHLR